MPDHPSSSGFVEISSKSQESFVNTIWRIYHIESNIPIFISKCNTQTTNQTPAMLFFGRSNVFFQNVILIRFIKEHSRM